MAGLLSVPLGTRIKSATVGRAVVAENTRGRAILIDPNPRATYIAYDDSVKAAVYVDQESSIRLGLSPNTYYLFLLGRLNTDMKGRIIGDEVVVEYLKLSDKQYEEFCEAYSEMDNVNSVVLKLESKKTQKGDFSFVKMTPSKEKPSQEVYEKIQNLDIEQLWKLVEVNCARSEEEYCKLLARNDQNDSRKRDAISPQERDALDKQSQGQIPIGMGNKDFEEADEFEED